MSSAASIQELCVIVGCPRHKEGHTEVRMPLPQRVDDVLRYVGTLRCKTVVAPPSKDDPGYCGQALMFLCVTP